MSRDRLASEPSEFEAKVEALVEKLGEDIATIAADGDEFSAGMEMAAVLLLDGLDTSDYDDDWDDPFEDDDDEIWPSFDDDEEDLFDPFVEDDLEDTDEATRPPLPRGFLND